MSGEAICCHAVDRNQDFDCFVDLFPKLQVGRSLSESHKKVRNDS